MTIRAGTGTRRRSSDGCVAQSAITAFRPSPDGHSRGMIILGLVLLLIGLVTGIGLLSTVGIILVLVGAVLMLLGKSGRQVGGRAHYW